MNYPEDVQSPLIDDDTMMCRDLILGSWSSPGTHKSRMDYMVAFSGDVSKICLEYRPVNIYLLGARGIDTFRKRNQAEDL